MGARQPVAPRGFTLIELMITVAVVAILGAIALPSYRDYLRRGELPEAFTTLSNTRVLLEQYYQDNRNYGASACADAAGGLPAAPPGTRFFSYGCTLGTGGQSYTLTATGTSPRTTGHVYSVTEANVQGTRQFKGTAQTGKACWLVRGGEC